MARLNEPPAAAPPSCNQAAAGGESVDALKRRFIRQNRDLAKNNSTQSLRIRSLEIEVSRLLADNLDLRENVLRLEYELSHARQKASSNPVMKIKEELRVKVAELSGIVDGIEEQSEGDSDNQRQDVREKLAAMQGQWRERQPLTEVMRESQMPTITEDKLFPRRTLGAEEIQAMRLSDHSNESPDLGPPPVAHFDCGDPVRHGSPLVSKASSKHTEEEVLPASLSVNLETRRKRKDAQPKLEIRRPSILAQSPTKPDADQSSMLKTGAKRKLADRDAEKPIRPPKKDDFSFSRRPATTEIKSVTGRPPGGAPDQRNAAEGQRDIQEDQLLPSSPARPVRKVLGDKSVNMSPRKVSSGPEKAGKDELHKSNEPKTTGRERVSARSRRVSAIPLPSPPRDVIRTSEIPPPEPIAADPPPKTPAAPDLFSPTSSEPSSQPAERRGDTPPPSDLSTLSTSTLDGGGRPSRRARAAVNYAEPSLISKMRRPGKQMVDAVTGLQDSRRAISSSFEGKTASRPLSIKKESEDGDEAWKSIPLAAATTAHGAEPTSPLGEKSTGVSSDPVMPIESTESDATASEMPSAASSTVSTLISTGRRRRVSENQRSVEATWETTAAMVKKMEELDLYEFKDSSSPTAEEPKPTSATAAKPRSHRRHSSVPKDMGHVVESAAALEGTEGIDSTVVLLPVRSERAASRRRSMML